MKVVRYDDEHYAIVVNKRSLKNSGIGVGDDVYVVVLEKGLLGVIKKSSFKEHLRKAVMDFFDEHGQHKNDDADNKLTLSNDEMVLIKKLMSYKFDKRNPDNVLPDLSNDEKVVLKKLVDRGVVEVYRRGKYKGRGVYIIDKNVYSKFVRDTDVGGKSVGNSKKSDSGGSSSDIVRELKKRGYVVVKSDSDAKRISDSLYKDIKKGNVVGIRGFDSYYYIMKKDVYEQAYDKMRKCFEECGVMSISTLSKKSGVPEQLCKGVINIMLENGEVIEKSKGKYQFI